ncbi:MAG: antibiotic biosynthesis monooxygenase [Candidatus Thiodiazotropha taylori]
MGTDVSPATTPAPSYYAVVFTSLRTEGDQGYARTAQRMLELARQQPGFLGVESVREELGITVSYWNSLEDIQAWKAHAEHLAAQQQAPMWYRFFRIRVCRVEREYGF